MNGSYRFTAAFMELLLENTFTSPHRLLTNYILQHMLCLPYDCGLPFASGEPDPPVFEVRGFDWSNLTKGMFFDALFFFFLLSMLLRHDRAG